MYLADLGAEVIKIENRAQGGDATRGMGPYFLGEHDSHFFQTFNLNKRSVCLDLKTPEGQAIFRKLVAKSDAVLNNLRGDQPDKLGLTYAALRECNPRLVCAHLSAYGRDNERRAWPGYDYLMQAEAGFLHVTGEPGTPPARMGLSIIDYMTGITTALALVSALFGAARSGLGESVRCCTASTLLPRHLVPQRKTRDGSSASQRPPERDARAVVQNTRWVDLHHVHDGEVLAGTTESHRGATHRPRSALCDGLPTTRAS
jgi:crotonobetainyl-CoA:carnitine CoA-transferase CaiB-like acyl-CoA transferase